MRIMIVDDDFLVRANLKRLIETSELCRNAGYTVLTEVRDGEEALQQMEILHPDIIISDIKMPHVDGLELQETIMKAYPEISMIMLSGYDDLDYVRQALKNGAVDYILKHELNEKVLLQTLERAKEHVREFQKEKNPITADNRLALKRNFMRNLFLGSYHSEEEILFRSNVLGRKIAMRNVSAVLVIVRIHEKNVISAHLLEYAILNIIDEILQDYQMGICSHISDEKYIFMIDYEKVYSFRNRGELFRELRMRMGSCLKTYLNLSADFYEGEIVGTIVDISKSYLSAEKIYENRFFPETAGYMRDTVTLDILSVFDAAREGRMVSAIRQNDVKETEMILADIFAQLRSLQPTVDVLQNFFLDLLSILKRAWIKRDIDLNRFFQPSNPQHIFRDFKNLYDAEKWFYSLMLKTFEFAGDYSQSPGSPYVEQAIGIIHRKYAQEISQSSVAEDIGLSASYLSRLFREDLNIGFSDFLCSYRIEKAKELLKEGRRNNKEIASMTGFQDDAYFARMFKRYTGMTPKEYRKIKSAIIS